MSSHLIWIPAPFGPRQALDWFNRIGPLRESSISFTFPKGVALEPGGAVLLKSASKAQHVVFKEDTADYLDQLGGVTDLRSARMLADQAADQLVAELGEHVEGSLVDARFSLEELGANVVHHSERPETGFGASRGYPANGRFQIAFADHGIGLKASLEKNPEFQTRVSDDTEAIKLAQIKGVTGSAQEDRGVGLYFLTDLSDRLGGDLWIASGAAMLHRSGPTEARRSEFRAIAPWQGVWICLDAPAQP